MLADLRSFVPIFSSILKNVCAKKSHAITVSVRKCSNLEENLTTGKKRPPSSPCQLPKKHFLLSFCNNVTTREALAIRSNMSPSHTTAETLWGRAQLFAEPRKSRLIHPGKFPNRLARPAGFEPAASWFVARRSIQLS